MAKKNILVLGGAGYIGSHMVRLLMESGYQPLVFDNLSTGHKEFIPKGVPFFNGDLRNSRDLAKCFEKYPIDVVMYFAASIVVSESVADPLKYYENNVISGINLIKEMVAHKIENLIFSSTAAVYGEPVEIPITENSPTQPENPYGFSKLMMEQILKDAAKAYNFRYISLRYFNVAGSHSNAETGIRYKVITHLIPSLLKVASGERKEFLIFGDDYKTPDGTCIRDFIYVVDLCRAHLSALEYLKKEKRCDVFNLGNGSGFSVKEVLDMAEKVSGRKIKVKISPRRAGDPARVVASSAKAKKILGWEGKASLEEIVASAWKWELKERERVKRN